MAIRHVMVGDDLMLPEAVRTFRRRSTPVVITSLSCNANTTTTTTFTFTGTYVGDHVVMAVPALTAGLVYSHCYVSATDTVTVVFANVTGSTIVQTATLLASVVRAPSLIVSDTFTRADSATLLGTADSGQTWTSVTSHVAGISSNQAYFPTGTNHNRAYVETGKSDVTVTCKIAAMAGSCGPSVRIVPSGTSPAYSSSFQTEPNQLVFVNDDGTVNFIYPAWTPYAAGDTVRLAAAGDTISVFIDYGSTGVFTKTQQITDTRNQTATKHGIRSSTNTGFANRIDDFTVTTP